MDKQDRKRTLINGKIMAFALGLGTPIFFYLLCSLCFITTSNGYYSNCTYSGTDHSIAHALLQNLQTASAIYVAQQRKPSEVFSDFVIKEGMPNGASTLSLQNLAPSLKKIDGIKTTKMTLEFKDRIKATYYLNGSDVTAVVKEIQNGYSQ